MFCTNCGNKIKEGALFCTECGTPAPKLDDVPVPKPVQVPTPAATPVQAPKKNGKGPMMVIIIIILALVLGGGAFALVSSGALDGIFASKDKDDDDDDRDRDDKDKDDEEESEEDDTMSGIVDETETVADRDEYGLVAFDSVNQTFIANAIDAYTNYCFDAGIEAVTLFYYNDDDVPELYIHDSNMLIYIVSENCDIEYYDSARSLLTVYGYNVSAFTKSSSVEDAYLVLTDPNYMLENADYILPDSNTRYLTKEDLEGLTKEQLRIARNEIFARHGRMFDSEDLQEYFNSKEWYTGTIPADEFNLEEILNDIEKANADLIKEVEAEMEN